MAPRLTPHIRFAAAALAAVIATFVIVGTAAADERTISGDVAVTAGAAYAQEVGGAQSLKLDYLQCEDAASRGALDGAAVMACSIVYETLKQRVFGGSFDALVAWWRQQRDLAAR